MEVLGQGGLMAQAVERLMFEKVALIHLWYLL
jgi:hypothetical protein